MGQYHEIINLDRMERLAPHGFKDGAKLMEFGDSGRSTMLGLGLAIAPKGRWHGDRIAIVGDYAEADDLDRNIPGFGRADSLYGSDDITDVSDTYMAMITRMGAGRAEGERTPAVGLERGWMHNRDTGEYLDPAVFGDSPNWGPAIHGYFGGVNIALAVLLAVSSGRGGGDYSPRNIGDKPETDLYVGRWAGQRIVITTDEDTISSGQDISVPVRNVLSMDRYPATYREDEEGRVTRFQDLYNVEAKAPMPYRFDPDEARYVRL